MRGSTGSLLVREATRQASRYGVQRASRVFSNSGTGFLLKSTVINTPARSLYSVSWKATFHTDSRAWSPFVHHMSTAAAQPGEDKAAVQTGEDMPSGKPSPLEDPANVTKLSAVQERFEKPTDISSYWGVVPKVQYKEDGTPWKWTCFTVSLFL